MVVVSSKVGGRQEGLLPTTVSLTTPSIGIRLSRPEKVVPDACGMPGVLMIRLICACQEAFGDALAQMQQKTKYIA